MKIALFSESYKPYISGVTVSVDTLARDLEKLGHEVKIFAPMYPGHRERGPKIFRFRSIPASYVNFHLAIPYSRKILPMIPKMGLEIIHSHSPYQLGLLSMRLAKKLKVPYVYTMHTLFSEYLHYVPWIPQRISRPFLSRFLKGFCRRCDCVIVPTDKLKELMIEEGVEGRVEVIPTGIDLDIVDGRDHLGVREKHSILPEEKILLYVGRLSKEKNIPFLFEVFQAIVKEKKDVRFLIVATGPKEEEFKEMAREMGLERKVVFVGQVEPPDIFSYYAASDVFIFSSLTETQGLVLAEAKASSLPAVAVSARGVADVVKSGEDGFLTGHDVKEFSDKALLLLKDEKLRKQFSEKARENAAKDFSSKTMAKKMEEVYRSLLS